MKIVVHFPKVEEVDDPPSPAAAFHRNNQLVVEVDRKLKGKERSAAIMAALRMHGYRGWLILPLGLLWSLQRWARDQTGAAIVTASTGAAVIAGGAGLLIPALLDGEEQVRAAPPIIITMSPTPSATASSPRPTPSTASRAPTLVITLPPTSGTRTSMRPEATPTPPPASEPEPSVDSPATETAPPDQVPTPVETVSVPPPTGAPTTTPPPTSDPAVTSRPEPTITTVAQRCTGLIHVDLNELADICLLG